MKTHLLSPLPLAAGIALLFTTVSHAQTTAVREKVITVPPNATTTTTKTAVAPSSGAVGTVQSTGQDSFIVRDAKEAPLTYRETQATKYVDESGNVVKRELLVPGVPVTVESSVKTGEGILRADRVIVHKQVATSTAQTPTGATATTSTTTTTTVPEKPTTAEGVMGLWETDRFTLATPKAGNVTFLYSKDTKIVDADEKHVDVIRMKQPGLPVTVKFSQEGDRLMANKITVNLRFVDVSR